MAEKNRFVGKLSIGKIGSGRLYAAGSFSSRARRGLAGALRQTRSAGKHTYAKNLSKQDLKTFQNLAGEELVKVSAHSSGLGRKARARIMGKAEALRQQGKISLEDKRDLHDIVQAMGPQSPTEKISNSNPSPSEPAQRAVHFLNREDAVGGENVGVVPSNTHLSNPAIDLVRHEATLGAADLDQAPELDGMEAVEERNNSKKILPEKNIVRGKKVELPDIKNLPDIDIG